MWIVLGCREGRELWRRRGCATWGAGWAEEKTARGTVRPSCPAAHPKLGTSTGNFHLWFAGLVTWNASARSQSAPSSEKWVGVEQNTLKRTVEERIAAYINVKNSSTSVSSLFCRPHIKSIFQSIAAKVENGDPCCDWVSNAASPQLKTFQMKIFLKSCSLLVWNCASQRNMKISYTTRDQTCGEVGSLTQKERSRSCTWVYAIWINAFSTGWRRRCWSLCEDGAQRYRIRGHAADMWSVPRHENHCRSEQRRNQSGLWPDHLFMWCAQWWKHSPSLPLFTFGK